MTVLDNKLRTIAKSLKAVLEMDNSKVTLLPEGFENRTIRWNKNAMNYAIQIYPEIKNNKIGKWIFWTYSYYDTEEANDFLDKLTKEDLELAGRF